ncbi:MAG: YbfB/YjiJ family MFS transporter [Desulfovibrionaceae bacterium]|jgi:MFS family permease|nr:YbfB/YjiJ family MFS transporter [Desulfovibrionaceae bacterium]
MHDHPSSAADGTGAQGRTATPSAPPNATPPPPSGPGAAASRYGWVVVGAGFLVMFACLGLARFAFGVLLPPTAAALDLSYAQRGYLGTGYFAGYLAMVALAPALTRRVGNRNAVALGLALIGATLCAVGATDSFGAALALYSLTGVGSGAANIAMMALIAGWFPPSLRGTATGAVIAGNGMGIIYSGYMVPEVVRAAGADGWRAGWVLLGALCAAVCVVAWVLLRDAPGSRPDRAQAAGTPRPPGLLGRFPAFSADERGRLAHLGCIYLLFGLTYMVYGSFIVTTLVDEYGLGQDAAGRFWAWVGFFSLLSGPLFGRLSDATSRRAGLMATFAVQTVAYALAGLAQGETAVWISVALYGLSAWAIPTIMTATVADLLGPARTAAGFSCITFFFAVGQVAGPTAAGWVAELTGSFAPAYLASACCTVLAVLLSRTLRRVRGADRATA